MRTRAIATRQCVGRFLKAPHRQAPHRQAPNLPYRWQALWTMRSVHQHVRRNPSTTAGSQHRSRRDHHSRLRCWWCLLWFWGPNPKVDWQRRVVPTGGCERCTPPIADARHSDAMRPMEVDCENLWTRSCRSNKAAPWSRNTWSHQSICQSQASASWLALNRRRPHFSAMANGLIPSWGLDGNRVALPSPPRGPGSTQRRLRPTRARECNRSQGFHCAFAIGPWRGLFLGSFLR